MPIAFEVDPVVESNEPPLLVPMSELFVHRCEGEVLCGSAAVRAVLGPGGPKAALVRAVQEAYDHHRALVLTPDAVWLTLAHGLGAHVLANAERLRHRLVRHGGREALSLSDARPLSELTAEDWAAHLETFEARVVEHTGPGLARLFAADFSTSTATDRIASRVLMLAAVSRYFDFMIFGVCGIPRVRLEGTVEDWNRIRERVALFGEWELTAWRDALLPICDELVRTAEGRPDLAFWRHVYKCEKTYGGYEVTGWLTQLFPYVETMTGALLPNEWIGKTTGEPWGYEPLGLHQFPSTTSSLVVRFQEGLVEHALRIHGGLAAATFDPTMREVGTTSAWWVERRSIDAVFARLGTPRSGTSAPMRYWPAASGSLITLLSRFGGMPILHGSLVLNESIEPRRKPRKIEPVEGYDVSQIEVLDERTWCELATLPDGRALCFRSVQKKHDGGWSVRESYAVAPVGEPPADDAPLIARSTFELLERLVADPRFFDRPDSSPDLE